jgi:glycosyltransferase involved in cell wall biosynthesis
MSKKQNELSVVLATRNEAGNIERCLKSVLGIADEIIVVDEHSEDSTRQIAENLGAKVYLEPHHEIFHITKQKALDLANGKWILQLDADEVVTPELGREILQVISMDSKEILIRVNPNPNNARHFKEHQRLLEKRDGVVGKKGSDVVAFFVPRLNMFLGKPLRFGGVYPDGVIRLVKKGYARFPQKSVHEQIEVDGEVSWLFNDLEHYDSPTLKRYFSRLNRYTELQAEELRRKHVGRSFFQFVNYSFIKPVYVFLNIFIRHKGFKDGHPGFLWAFFSSTHFPVAYYKYWTEKS